MHWFRKSVLSTTTALLSILNSYASISYVNDSSYFDNCYGTLIELKGRQSENALLLTSPNCITTNEVIDRTTVNSTADVFNNILNTDYLYHFTYDRSLNENEGNIFHNARNTIQGQRLVNKIIYSSPISKNNIQPYSFAIIELSIKKSTLLALGHRFYQIEKETFSGDRHVFLFPIRSNQALSALKCDSEIDTETGLLRLKMTSSCSDYYGLYDGLGVIDPKDNKLVGLVVSKDANTHFITKPSMIYDCLMESSNEHDLNLDFSGDCQIPSPQNGLD